MNQLPTQPEEQAWKQSLKNDLKKNINPSLSTNDVQKIANELYSLLNDGWVSDISDAVARVGWLFEDKNVQRDLSLYQSINRAIERFKNLPSEKKIQRVYTKLTDPSVIARDATMAHTSRVQEKDYETFCRNLTAVISKSKREISREYITRLLFVENENPSIILDHILGDVKSDQIRSRRNETEFLKRALSLWVANFPFRE